MTPEEQIEWNYIYQERLGMMCGEARPTEEQMNLARGEADEHVKKLKE